MACILIQALVLVLDLSQIVCGLALLYRHMLTGTRLQQVFPGSRSLQTAFLRYLFQLNGYFLKLEMQLILDTNQWVENVMSSGNNVVELEDG